MLKTNFIITRDLKSFSNILFYNSFLNFSECTLWFSNFQHDWCSSIYAQYYQYCLMDLLKSHTCHFYGDCVYFTTCII